MKAVAMFKKRFEFDSKTFPATIDSGRNIAAFAAEQTIFAQSDPSHAGFYVQQGKVILDILSSAEEEATITLLNDG